jgi:hypothetical protein
MTTYGFFTLEVVSILGIRRNRQLISDERNPRILESLQLQGVVRHYAKVSGDIKEVD